MSPVSSASSQPLISLTKVAKEYPGPHGPTLAVQDLSLDIAEGELVAVMGKSGSGKTTLINLLTGIDTPTHGSIRVGPTAIHTLTQEQLTRWRGVSVGIVFQFFHLLPSLTVAENVMLPMDFCNTYPPRKRRDRARQLLCDMGIDDQADKLPSALSGGQQQRAAIARALANDPPLIVADEPTGNLDSQTAEDVMTFFARLARGGKTVIIATHERDLERHFARSITLSDGSIRQELRGSA